MKNKSASARPPMPTTNPDRSGIDAGSSRNELATYPGYFSRDCLDGHDLQHWLESQARPIYTQEQTGWEP